MSSGRVAYLAMIVNVFTDSEKYSKKTRLWIGRYL